MAEIVHPSNQPRLARIEPDDRLVVLARTIQARDPGTETALKDNAVNWARFGQTCLGQALYRHRTVFRNASDAQVWSHLELSYFRSGRLTLCDTSVARSLARRGILTRSSH